MICFIVHTLTSGLSTLPLISPWSEITSVCLSPSTSSLRTETEKTFLAPAPFHVAEWIFSLVRKKEVADGQQKAL